MDKQEKQVSIEIIKGFKFAYRGCDVVEYKKGETVTVGAECADLALAEKWAKPAGKARPAAPENKDAAPAGGAPENKSE
jgi:hypothetical protein